jgi:hypothetical protein
MAYTTVFDDVVFIEGKHPDANIIKNIKVDLGYRIGAQLKNIKDVKRELAMNVKLAGGNCLVDFEYGQKAKWLAIDDVAFWGSGKIAILPPDIYNEIIAKSRQV